MANALLLNPQDRIPEVTAGDEDVPLTPQEFCAKYGHNVVTGGTEKNPTRYCSRCFANL